MSGRMRLSIAMVLFLLVVPGAHAAVITIGPPFSDTGGPQSYQQCVATGCTLSQLTVGQPGVVLRAPSAGTIVRWRVAGSGQVAFTVLRPQSDGSFTAIATTPTAHLQPGIQTFGTNIQVAAGDAIGVDVPGDTDPRSASYVALDRQNGGTFAFWEPTLQTGANAKSSGTASGTIQLNADLETSSPPSSGGGGSGGGQPSPTVGPTIGSPAACVVPKLKGLTLRKARARLARANCRLGKVRHRRSRHAKRGTVVRQGARPGRRLAAGTHVAVWLARR